MEVDSAIKRAKVLLKEGKTKDAFTTLAARIVELNKELETLKEAPAKSDYSHRQKSSFPRVLVIVLILVLILVASIALAVALGVFQQENYDASVQEWWSYNAPAADEFISAISGAVLISITDATSDDDFGALFLQRMLEASDYHDQFESAEYPFKAKEARDSILRGMTEYSLFAYGVKEDLPLFLETEEFSPETMQYLEDAREHMRQAVKQIKELTGEDADFLVMEEDQE